MTDILAFVTAVVPVIVTSAIAILAVIAPLTKSDYDNKALDALRFVEDKILSIFFPSLVKASELEPVEAPKAEAKAPDAQK
jgi:hypothetical protein